MKKEKKMYVTPLVELLEVKVEQVFAESQGEDKDEVGGFELPGFTIDEW